MSATLYLFADGSGVLKPCDCPGREQQIKETAEAWQQWSRHRLEGDPSLIVLHADVDVVVVGTTPEPGVGEQAATITGGSVG